MATLTELAEHTTIISYCVDRGMTPIQTLREMGKTRGFGSVSRTLVYTWHNRFKTGSDVTTAEKRRQTEKEPSSTNKKIEGVLDEDRRQTVREIAEKVGLSKSAVQMLLSDELSMSRVSALWVSILLTNEEMFRRVLASRKFLKRHKRDPNFFDRYHHNGQNLAALFRA